MRSGCGCAWPCSVWKAAEGGAGGVLQRSTPLGKADV